MNLPCHAGIAREHRPFVDVVHDLVLALNVEIRPTRKREPMRSDRKLELAPSKVVTRTLSSKRSAASCRVDLATRARAKHSPVVRSRCCKMLICWPQMMQKPPCDFTNMK